MSSVSLLCPARWIRCAAACLAVALLGSPRISADEAVPKPTPRRAYATPKTSYDDLAQTSWKTVPWCGYDFVFQPYGTNWGKDHNRRFGVEAQKQNLLTPVWDDPDYINCHQLPFLHEWAWSQNRQIWPGETRQECYETCRQYYLRQRQERIDHAAANGWLQRYPGLKTVPFSSMDGHGWLTHGPAGWGCDWLGIEIGENIIATQLHVAFLRGAARMHGLPTFCDVSQWHGGTIPLFLPGQEDECVQYLSQEDRARFVAEVIPKGGGACLNGGHSSNLLSRMWHLGWLSGLTMVCPEGSQECFFVGRARDLSQLPDETPFALSPIGKRAKAMHEMTQKYPARGIPYTPFAVMLDRHAGFHGFQHDTMHPWGVVKPTEDDVSAYRFLSALVPGSLGELNPESAEMKPGPHTPYGMSFDVVTDDIGSAALNVYPVCILIGHHDFPPETVARLESYLDNGGTLYLTHKQAAQLGTTYERLRTRGSIRLFADDKDAMAETVQSIFSPLCAEHLPVEVTGGSIEYTINRTPKGWLVGLLNNDGIAKGNLTGVRIDRSCTKRITVRLKNHAITSAHEWCEDRHLEVDNGDSVTVEVPAGEVRVLELTMH
jgi:hypothetical protein